jgi:hypothetical protein
MEDEGLFLRRNDENGARGLVEHVPQRAPERGRYAGDDGAPTDDDEIRLVARGCLENDRRGIVNRTDHRNTRIERLPRVLRPRQHGRRHAAAVDTDDQPLDAGIGGAISDQHRYARAANEPVGGGAEQA